MPSEPTEKLNRRWEEQKAFVGWADLRMDNAFKSSLSYWQTGESVTWDNFVESGDVYQPRRFDVTTRVEIRGDCRADISLMKGGLVHIYGDVYRSLNVHECSEMVIGGVIRANAGVKAEGIHQLFVGADVYGTVSGDGVLKVWISANFGGKIEIAGPMIYVYINGNFDGELVPSRYSTPYLFLDVNGYMPYEALVLTANHGFARFHASIANSDRPPGIYPEQSEYARRAQMRRFCRWAIRSQVPTRGS